MRSPDLGAVPLATYLGGYLASRVDLAPRTLAGYHDLAGRWLTAELRHPNGRTVNLAVVDLRDLSPLTVRDWYAAALHEARQRALRRLAAADRQRRARAVHAARLWARENGYPVKRSGRLSPTLLAAWRASGSPAAATYDLPPTAPPRDAGKVTVARAYQLLRSVLATAHRDGVIAANPCNIAGPGQPAPSSAPTPPPPEVTRLAAQMPARFAAAVHVAAWSGLRAGELFALTRAHVDLSRGTVRVERALLELPGQPVVLDRPRHRARCAPCTCRGPSSTSWPTTWPGSSHRVLMPWCSASQTAPR